MGDLMEEGALARKHVQVCLDGLKIFTTNRPENKCRQNSPLGEGRAFIHRFRIYAHSA